MKYLPIAAILFLFFACSDAKNKANEKPAQMSLMDTTTSHYKEWYPGRRQIKMEGEVNELRRRQGLWTYFNEKGVVLGTTHYENGIREGFSVVKYPNGKMHYTGEYRNDKMMGTWKFYDEDGVVMDSTFH